MVNVSTNDHTHKLFNPPVYRCYYTTLGLKFIYGILADYKILVQNLLGCS